MYNWIIYLTKGFLFWIVEEYCFRSCVPCQVHPRVCWLSLAVFLWWFCLWGKIPKSQGVSLISLKPFVRQELIRLLICARWGCIAATVAVSKHTDTASGPVVVFYHYDGSSVPGDLYLRAYWLKAQSWRCWVMYVSVVTYCNVVRLITFGINRV